MSAEDTITAIDAAAIIGCHPSTINKWHVRGLFKAVGQYKQATGDYGYLYPRDEVMACVQNFKRRHTVTCNSLSDVEVAYLAGLFDGEGCFTATLRGSYYHYRAKLKMTCAAPVRWAWQATGLGHIYNQEYPGTQNQPTLDWFVSGRQSAYLAALLLPH